MKNILIDKHDLNFYRTVRRNLVFNELYQHYLKLSNEEGLRQNHIAKKLDWHRSHVSKLFSEPSNLTLDTISDLLEAMSADMKFYVYPANKAEYTADEFNREFRERQQWEEGQNVYELDTGSRNRRYRKESSNVTLTSGESFGTAAQN